MEDKKIEILERLVTAGHITFKEALLFIEIPQKNLTIFNQIPKSYVGVIYTNPYTIPSNNDYTTSLKNK